MPTEVHAPGAIAASTNLTGAVSAIQDDPDSPDANWLTATSATAATDLRVTFPTPTGNPDGSQDFKLWLRKTAGTPTPTANVYLYEDAASQATLVTAEAITSTTGQLVTASWTSSQLNVASNGSAVECRVASATGNDAPTTGAMPAYSSAATAALNATMTTTVNPAFPATVNAGDFVLLQVMHRNDDNDGAGPGTVSGMTSFPGNPYGGANNSRQSLYYRIATGSEGGNTVAVTCTGGTTNDLVAAKTYRFTAANGFAATPIEGITTNAGTASPMAAPTTGGTPGGTNRRAVCVGSIASSDSTIGSMTGETAGNWTEAITGNTTTGGDGTVNVQTADASAGTAISGGSIAFTTSTSSHWNTVAFYLVPADIAGAAVNTVEIGAVEWNCLYVATANATADAGATTSLSLSGQAGAVTSTPNALTPAAGAASLAGQAPSVLATAVATPSSQAVDIAGQQAAVAAGAESSSGAPQSISLSGVAPAVAVSSQVVADAPQSVITSGYAPAAQTQPPALEPAAGALEIAGLDASVLVSISVPADASQQLLITGLQGETSSPDQNIPAGATTGMGLSGQSGGISAAALLAAASSSIELAYFSGSATSGATATPPASALSLSGLGPAVRSDAVLLPAFYEFAVLGLNPSLLSTATASAAALISLETSGLTPEYRVDWIAPGGAPPQIGLTGLSSEVFSSVVIGALDASTLEIVGNQASVTTFVLDAGPPQELTISATGSAALVIGQILPAGLGHVVIGLTGRAVTNPFGSPLLSGEDTYFPMNYVNTPDDLPSSHKYVKGR